MATIILKKIIIDPLLSAYSFLTMALQTAKSDLEKAGAIQAFEISYELSWKTMKRILAERGMEVNSPRETFRQAAIEKLIEDPEFWFEVIKKRNLTTHTYNHAIANELFQFLPQFSKALNHFIQHIQTL